MECLPPNDFQPHGGGPSQSIVPCETVHPVMTVLPAGRSKTLQVLDTLPCSKPPFWNFAPEAADANTNSKMLAVIVFSITIFPLLDPGFQGCRLHARSATRQPYKRYT